MTDGIVIDANVINVYYQEYIKDEGPVFKMINWLLDNIGVAVNNHIAKEWENTCDTETFLSWFADNMKIGKIRKVESIMMPQGIKKRMENDYGFPANTNDYHYIKCAFNTEKQKYIVTYNYDFFEPRCPQSSISARKRAREDREGKFCRFLRRHLKITVGLPDHCISDYGIP